MMRNIILKDFIEYTAILVLILNSGGNPLLRSIYIYVAVCLMLLFYRPNLTLKNTIRLFLMIMFFILNTCVLNVSPPISREVVILVARIIGCSIIASNISIYEFRKKYLKIMTFVSIFGLFWFLLIILGFVPPFTKYTEGIWCSIFQTVGFSLDTKRNAGIFSEPGLFQIFINIAIIFLIFDEDIDSHSFKKLFILFSITLLSTVSAMGYICYAINMTLCIKYRREFFGWISKRRKMRNIFITVIFFAVFVIEVSTHVISGFITTWQSYASRHDDTLMSLMIARDFPLFGVGVANDISKVWKSYFGRLGSLELYHTYSDLSRSNGLGNGFATAGIPFMLIYLFLFFKQIKRILFIKDKFDLFMIIVLFILFFCGEPYMFTPFFLSFLFEWHISDLPYLHGHKAELRTSRF